MACDVYVEVRALDARSNTKIWPLSTDNATREPSGLYTGSAIYRETMPKDTYVTTPHSELAAPTL
jgi:hypothetical protein